MIAGAAQIGPDLSFKVYVLYDQSQSDNSNVAVQQWLEMAYILGAGEFFWYTQFLLKGTYSHINEHLSSQILVWFIFSPLTSHSNRSLIDYFSAFTK